MACDTDLSSGTIALEDKISEKYDPGPAPNTAGGVPLKIRNEQFKVPHQNLQNTLKEHCVMVSRTSPTTSLAPDNVNSNTFMLKLNDHSVVHSKLKRRRYSQYKVPVPGTVLARVPQTSKLPHTNRDCVKSVNSTANIHNPDDRHGKAASGSGTICLSTFHNSEQVHMNSQCGNRTALTEESPSPQLSGNECGSHLRDDHTGDSVFINSDVKTDDLQKTQRHGDSETQAAWSMPHHQQPVRKEGADQVVLESVEHIPSGDHSGRVGLPQMDVARRIEPKEVPWQEEVLKPYCDCQISSFTDDMARACTISHQGFPVRLPHVGSVLIQEHQLVTFVRNGKMYVSVSELKAKNMIHNFTKFSSLLRSQSRLLPLAGTEVEFLKQKGRVKDSRNARLVSLDHLRWIYRTQAALQQDAFNTAVSQCPWYSLTLGHSCRKVAMLNPTQDYVCPLCLRVEQRPIEATTQRYECHLCFQANELPSVPQSQMPKVNYYANKRQKVEQTSFVVREDGKLQTVIMGHIKVAEKNVAAFSKGDVTYVSCRHLLVHLYQFPWENFVSLVKSLDLCFMEAPVMVCHFFQKLAYPQELVNGRVWCSAQNLRCIACFSVGQMNNTQYLEKNKILALIAQGKYVEEFPYDARGGETEKSLTEPKRVLPSHEYQVHNRQVSTTNSSANKVRQAPPGKTVIKVDAARGQILVCRGDVKTMGNLCLPQTAGQTSMRVQDERGLKLDASDGQRVVGGSVKIVGNLCQTQTVAQNRTRTVDQMGLNVNASVGQTLVGGGDVSNAGNLSQTQTAAKNKTKQMCVNFDGSGKIVIVGNTTTSTRSSDPVPGIQCFSGLTQSSPVKRSPTVPPNYVFCCERSQIPGGNYFVKENKNFTDYKSESGLVFRVMKQPTASQNKIDILSVAAEEIREVASQSEYTSDMDNSGFSNTNVSSSHQSSQSMSFEQCSNLQQLTSEQTTHLQSMPGLDVVATNVGTVCKDIRTVEPTPVLSDNNPSRPESDLSDGQDKLLSMPVNFFQDSPIGSPKRKCFLSPNKMHEVTKPGGDVIVFQSEGGEHYECTALGPINELKDCLLVVSPEKPEKEKPKTISPDSACSQKSVDSGRSEGKSESCTPVGPAPTTSLNQSQNSNVCGEDNYEALPAEGAKNMNTKIEQVSRVTSLVDEEYKPDTSGVLVAQGMCFNASQSTETNETGPSSMSPIKSMETLFSTPRRLSVSSPNKSPVITIIYKKLVTQCNLDKSDSPSSLSVLASVAEAIDEDGDGKDVGTDGGSCKVKSVTVDNQPCNKAGSADGRSNVADDEATDADAKESSPLLPETQSNANSGISAEDEDMGSESKEECSPLLQETQSNSDIFPENESSVCDTEETSPLLQAKWNNTEIFPDDRSSVCDTEETSPLLQETESDMFTEHEVSVGDAEEGSDCCSTCSHDERLSASDTDHSSSSGRPLGGESRSPGISNSSIEHDIEICTVEKSSSVPEEQCECSEDVGKCCTQMEDAKMSTEEVLEKDLLHHQDPQERGHFLHQDPEERTPSHHHQGPEDKAAELGLDARGKVDTDLVMDDSCYQLQTSEGIEETNSGNSRCFQGETEGTDLCHGGSVEPDTAVDVSSVEPSNAVDVSSVEPDAAVDVSSVEPDTAVDVSSVEPDAAVGVSSVEPDTAVGVSSVEPDTAVGVSSVEPDAAVGVSSVEPDTAVGVSSVEPDAAVGVSSVEPDTAVERKSKKRKRSQSIHKQVKRKKTVMSEMECMATELSVTSSHPSSKAPSRSVTVDAESPEFSVCDNNQTVPVEGAMFPETDKFPKFSEADNHQHIPVETTAKSPKFLSGGKNDNISAETVSPSECATKDHIAGDSREAEIEGLTEQAVEEMKHVLENVQVDGLVVADNRLQFQLKLHPSLHTHFKGETQKKLVERLSRLVVIGYILQQRRQTADGDEQTSTSTES